MKILVIEDNRELANTMQQFMAREGYICELAYTSREATDKLVSFPYDIIILDIMLPDGDGLSILQFMRSEKIQSSVLIISAKNALDDKINGLEMGADDYITKPFHLTELHARLKAIYRRKNLQGENTVTFKEIVLNTGNMEARVNGTLLTLTKKEFDLLLYFLINKNRIITRQSIAEHLWGDYTDNLANFDFVYQHIKNLRKKISAAGGKDYLGTVYGLGYKFDSAS